MSTPARSRDRDGSAGRTGRRSGVAGRRVVWPYGHVVRLFPHKNGQWAKKIRGRMCYFGVLADPAAALARYQAEGPGLHRGADLEHSRAMDAGLTVEHGVNAWLAQQLARVEAGELTAATFRDYRMVGAWIGEAVGWETLCGHLTPAKWSAARAALGKTYSTPGTVRKFVLLTRAWARWCERCRLVDAIDFGPDWRAPSQRAMRLHQSQQRSDRPRLLEAGDIRWLLLNCRNPQLRAMIWLGINCGFGQTDCATLRVEAVRGREGSRELGIEGAMGREGSRELGIEGSREEGTGDGEPACIVGVRRKTGVARICPLWPETAAALARVVGGRRSGLVFVTRAGRPWVRVREHGDGRMVAIDSVSTVLRKTAAAAGLAGLRFYSLRRTFRTIADTLRDQRAIDTIMGHAGGDGGADWQPSAISGAYVEQVSMERLVAVSEHVRGWMLGSA